jgi:K+-sensing histidine kinase KdpD
MVACSRNPAPDRFQFNKHFNPIYSVFEFVFRQPLAQPLYIFFTSFEHVDWLLGTLIMNSGQIAVAQPSERNQWPKNKWANAYERFGIAFVWVAVALGSSLVLQRLFPYPFLFLFFAAVMASAWIGGTGPGIFAVILSTVAVDYYFVPPLHSLEINATDTAYFVAFILCALAASWVSSIKRTNEEELRETRDHLEARVAERTAELEKTIAELQENERQREQLVSEKSVLSVQLEARKIVERAKGILQREMKINEDEAYKMIQRQSQQMRKSMKEISETIILNDDLKRSSQ